MDLGLTDKVALVTGASRGIGAAIAQQLAREGCRLAICARGADALQALPLPNALKLVSDLSQPKAADALVAAVIAHFGRLDIVVHNLGGNREGNTNDAWDFTLDINLGTAVRVCRPAIEQMKAQRSGSIVFIASVAGTMVGGAKPQYNAAKAAEIMYARSLGEQLAPFGIRANAVSPGSILFPGGSWDKRQRETPEKIADFVKENLPLQRFGTVEEVARVVAFVASDVASLVTGANIAVDGAQRYPGL